MLSHFTCPCGADPHAPATRPATARVGRAGAEALYFNLSGWADSIDADYADPTVRREDPRREAVFAAPGSD